MGQTGPPPGVMKIFLNECRCLDSIAHILKRTELFTLKWYNSEFYLNFVSIKNESVLQRMVL